MKKLLFILLATFSLNALAQSKIKKLPSDFYSVKWISSNEEMDATRDYMTYRKEGSREFPIARFRATYTFGTDGSCKWLKLEPNDLQNIVDGKFEFNRRKQTIKIFDEKGTLVQTFRVVGIDKDVLKLKNL